MKTTITILALTLFAHVSQSQITANPGTNNWTSPSAWMGGVVPGLTDPVVIGMNATIVVDIPLTHNADIDINGGVLTSMLASNSLTMNGADLTLMTFGSQVAFAISIPVPITINDGVLTNGGVYMSGDLLIDNASALATSVNNGDFMVTGDMELAGTVDFDNNLAMNISGDLILDVNTAITNNQSINAGGIENDGIVDNYAFMNVVNSVFNYTGANYWSDSGNSNIGGDLDNEGNVSMNDNMAITGLLDNTGTFNNDGGSVTTDDYYNSGTTTGSLNGSYAIASSSENTASGIIDGLIDVCDVTLMPGDHLDIDAGVANVDFVTVTFCTINIAGIESNELSNVTVSPNPSNGIISLNGIESADVSIHSLQGELVYITKSVGDGDLIDISNFADGAYVMNISSGNSSKNVRILKH